MRAEFESVRSGFLGLNVYGPKLVKLKKRFHQMVGTKDNFGYLIGQLIASKIWDREEEMFTPYSTFGNYCELEYVYMPKTSFGFGAMAVKNSSFDKIFNIKMYDKQIVYPKKLDSNNFFNLDLHPGITDIIVWECKNSAKEEEGKPVVDVRFSEADTRIGV